MVVIFFGILQQKLFAIPAALAQIRIISTGALFFLSSVVLFDMLEEEVENQVYLGQWPTTASLLSIEVRVLSVV